MSRFLALFPAIVLLSALLTIGSSVGPTLAAPTPPGESGMGTIAGTVRNLDGGPVARLTLDLFHAPSDGSPAGYLTSTTTAADGSYRLSAPSLGCYVVIFDASFSNIGSGDRSWDRRPSVCIEVSDTVVRVDASVASGRSAPIGGRIAFEDGAGVEHLAVGLFATSGDGTRGAHLGSGYTDANGLYGFDVAPSCYVVVISASDGTTFIDGDSAVEHRTAEHEICTDGATPVPALDAIVAGTANPITTLTEIELEIVRLTNELRARPDGPLARQGPTPDCVTEEFYEIEVDPATGHPMAVSPLVVDERVAVAMARPWAEHMQLDSTFVHRPSDSQRKFYLELEIPIAAWGENIAWFSGYDSALAAAIHFEGWRQSDTGHYCSMLTGRFTHVGVGELRRGAESWAVQNFYQAR